VELLRFYWYCRETSLGSLDICLRRLFIFQNSEERMNEQIAEITGALIGDGCLSEYHSKSEGRIRRQALFTGHLVHDKPYYVKRLRPLIKISFNTQGYLQERPSFNCIRLVLGSGVFDFFKSLGLPVGKKENLSIPPKIMQNPLFAVPCVRGIFDTDGTIYRRYSKAYQGHGRIYDHLVIQIKMKAPIVIKQIKSILERQGIKSNKIIFDRDYPVLRITSQSHINKFFEIVSPQNNYHRERYLKRCHVPTF